MIRVPMLLVVAIVAGVPAGAETPSTTRGEVKLIEALAGRVAGKPVDCINLRAIRSSRIIDGTAIIYDTGRTIYVNRPTGGQWSLHRDDIMVTDTHSSQLCSVDTVRLVDQGSRMFTGVVGLGRFVPYVKADTSG